MKYATKPRLSELEDRTHGIVQGLLGDYGRHDFQVRLWNGYVWGEATQPTFTLSLKHPRALQELYWSPSELSLGESYVRGDFEVEGNLEAAFELGDYLLHKRSSDDRRTDVLQRLLHRRTHGPQLVQRPAELSGALHSPERDREAVTFHYNLPSDFYALWLDSRMVYSCAYFQGPGDSLDTAQWRKLDYICRKLRLRPGDRLLDIGCGWGALALYAAAEYGAQTLGITLSETQAAWARQNIRTQGLEDRCRVEVRDYRELKDDPSFDKVVSVGMVEHVGEAKLAEYFRRAWEALKPGGVFLNHGIAYSATCHRPGPSFIDRYIFPDGELIPINTTLRAAEESGFEVRDVENLREHYALTLRHWLRRLERNADEARRITDDPTYRRYRIYLAGSAHAFRRGRLNLHQTLLAKPQHGESGLPLTRDDWYR
jgi:cyclopropane-fatty-acyl-phospholipid synthase